MTVTPLTPYPFQRHDIDFLKSNGGTGLVVTEVGGGKTLVAVQMALELGFKSVLIIAPQGTHVHAWGETLHLQSKGEHAIRRLSSDKKGKAALADLMWGEPGWFICTPQWFARQKWTGIRPECVIFDEIHVAGAYENETRRKLHQLQADAKLALSGTPLRNKVENAWSIVKWLYPDLITKTYWQWRMSDDLEYKYDNFAPQNRRITGEKVPGKIVNSLPCYIQHLQRENCCQFHPKGFLPDLPAPAVEVRVVKMTPQQRKFYKQMEDSCVAWLTTEDSEGRVPVVAELPVVARNMLRFAALGLPSVRTVTKRRRDKETGQMISEEKEQLYFEPDCESPKLDELLSVLKEIGDKQVVVYTHSQRFASVVVDRLAKHGVESFEWSSANTQRRRDQALTEFKSGELRVIVAVISAFGTGTDGVQRASNTEIYLSEDEDPTNMQQVFGRQDRTGQKRQVVRIMIHSAETLDEGIMGKNLMKALSMSATLRKAKA